MLNGPYHQEPPTVRRSRPLLSGLSVVHSQTLAPMSYKPLTPCLVAPAGAARGQISGSLVLALCGRSPVVHGYLRPFCQGTGGDSRSSVNPAVSPLTPGGQTSPRPRAIGLRFCKIQMNGRHVCTGRLAIQCAPKSGPTVPKTRAGSYGRNT